MVLAVSASVGAISLASYLGASPFADYPIGDAYAYDQMARSLAANGFRHDAVFHQAPLYPYLLGAAYALFGPDVHAGAFFGALLGALVPWLLFRIVRRELGPTCAIVAGLLAIGYGPLLLFSPKLLPTVPAIVLQLAFLDRLPPLAERRASRWIGAGVFLGLAILARANMLLVFPIAVAVSLVARARGSHPFRRLALVLAPAALIVLPVALHNLSQGEGPVLVAANYGETFYHGNNPGAVGTYSLMAGIESANVLEQARVSKRVAESEAGRPLNVAEVQRHWLAKGIAFSRRAPERFLWLELQKLRLLLGAEEAPDIYSPALEARAFTRGHSLAFLHLPLVLPFALTGILLLGRRMPIGLSALAFVHVATLLVFYVSNRYRLPLEILLLVPAAYTIGRLGRRRTWVFLVPALALVVWLRVGADESRVRRSEGMVVTNLGVSMGRANAFAAAEGAFRHAVRLAPDWPRTHHYLGRTLAAQRRGEEATTAFEQAARHAPNDPEVLTDLGFALAATGRIPEAASVLERVVALAPGRAVAWAQLARVHLSASGCEAALATFARARAALGDAPDETLERAGTEIRARCASP